MRGDSRRARARQGQHGESLPGSFETSAEAAGSFSTFFVYGLGLDYYSRYLKKVTALDAAAAQAAARKYSYRSGCS